MLRGYIDENHIPRDGNVGFGIDGASSIREQGQASLRSTYECVSFCHMEALYNTQLVAKELRAELQGDILQQATSIVSYIKPHQLHARLLEKQIHNEAWRLSRVSVGKIFRIERLTNCYP